MNPKEIRKFKVMLAESGRQLFVLQEYIKERPDTELCGAACDGEALLELLGQGFEPDVLILDSDLRRISGIRVLYKMRSLRLKRMPQILMTTCTADDGVHKRYIEAGAKSLVVKPYKMEELLNQAIDLCLNAPESVEVHLDYLIRLYLEQMHLTVGDAGYWYLSDAVKQMLQHPALCGLCKEVYEHCGARFGVSPKAIESGIRRAIERIHYVSPPTYREMQKFLKLSAEKPVSNRDFLGRMAQQIALEWEP